MNRFAEDIATVLQIFSLPSNVMKGFLSRLYMFAKVFREITLTDLFHHRTTAIVFLLIMTCRAFSSGVFTHFIKLFLKFPCKILPQHYSSCFFTV